MAARQPKLPNGLSLAEQTARKNRISTKLDQYKWDHQNLDPLPLIDTVPVEELFNPRYLAGRNIASAGIAENNLKIKAEILLGPLELRDYEGFFPVLPRPSTMQLWRTDVSFAEQRISGVNPLVLRQATKTLLDGLPFKDSQVDSVLGTDSQQKPYTLQSAIAEGLLYIADYRHFATVRGGTNAAGPKFLPAPIALFAWRRLGLADRGELVPVAIVKRAGQRAISPRDRALDWLMAKLAVQIADANHHEMSSHLCRTHFVMEPFAVATARTLDDDHPVAILLKPHFRFLLANNDMGKRLLISKGGTVEQLMAGTLEESLNMVKASYREWDFTRCAFEQDIQDRGMSDANLFPHYPYRDDGRQVWRVLDVFAREYVELYYSTDADVQQDAELQAWVAELVSPNAGKVVGFPDIQDRQTLQSVLTNLLFINGPLHSAVNFPQYEFMAFCPNMPLAAYTEFKEDNSEMEDLLRALPPAKYAVQQLDTVRLLTAYRYDKLGFYDEGDFEETDPQLKVILGNLRQNLATIERSIELDNTARPIPYMGLLPSQIINSISI